MLDRNSISALSLVINDYFNKNIEHGFAKKRLNAILHNKSIPTVIKEVRDYTGSMSGNEKNIVVLTAVLALLGRDLDCIEDIKKSILKFKLEGCLYGGLYLLFSGDSERFSLRIKLNDDSFKNKYDYLTLFSDFYYWDFILAFQAVQILQLLDSKKFEQLALTEQSKLILLNMATYHINIEPSGALISSLLKSSHELKQNIGF